MSEAIIVRSPYDGSIVGEVPSCTSTDVNHAVAAAKEAANKHALPAWRRAEILDACSDMIGENREDLARLIARESAKPISTARIEAARALSTMGFAAIEARKLTGEIVPTEGSMIAEGKLAYTMRVPVGVVGAISPFNFPLNLVCHKVGPAIAAGCPVVLKPASQTPFSAMALADILAECGLPDGWLTVVTGSGGEVGNALVEHPDVPYITFTGSADVGWSIAARAPKKRVALELGNSTPLIIEPDGDWQQAALATATAGYSHAGQSCISIQRVYVHSDIADQFTDQLVQGVAKLKLGDPLDDETNVSTVIDESNRQRIQSWIAEAVAQGATVRCGGTTEGPFNTPTILTNVNLNMKVCSEEIFGPVVTVQTYDTLDEAIALANGTRYGLQAGIFTSDISNAFRATRELEFGGVLVNEVPTWRADIVPYGGVKDSGNTREGPAFAVKEMTETRLVVIDL